MKILEAVDVEEIFQISFFMAKSPSYLAQQTKRSNQMSFHERFYVKCHDIRPSILGKVKRKYNNKI